MYVNLGLWGLRREVGERVGKRFEVGSDRNTELRFMWDILGNSDFFWGFFFGF